MKLGSLFDGIGGFPYAASFFGIEALWASEVMPSAISVTRRHLPRMEHVGDITQLNGAALPPVDIITFGSPCQGLSAAGKRKGFADPRSGLFTEAIRIINEMREATHGRYPTWAIWENVPGALSSNGGLDFKAVLEAFTEAEIPVPRSGKWASAGMVRSGRADLAWCVYNAQYFGTAQRRRRIFLVCDFGGKRAGEILFIPKSLRGYFAAGGTPRQGPAAYATQGADGGMSDINDKNCLTSWDTQQSRIFTDDGASPTLAGADGGGGRNPGGLIYTAGFCAGAGAKANSIGYKDECAPTLKGCACGFQMPTVLCASFMGDSSLSSNGKEASPTLKPRLSGTSCFCEPELARTLIARGDSSPCADRGQNIVAVGVIQNQHGNVNTSDVAYPLTTNSNASGRSAPIILANSISLDSGQARKLTLSTARPLPEESSIRVGPHLYHPDVSGTLCASGVGLSRSAGMTSEPDLCATYALQGNMTPQCALSCRDAAIHLVGRQDRNDPNGSGVSEYLPFTFTACDTTAAAPHEPIPIHDKATRHKNGGAGNGLGIGKAGDPAPTLTSGDHHEVMMASGKASVGTLLANAGTKMWLGNQEAFSGDYFPIQNYTVRRLTPLECERLQGYPDGWTEFGHDGKPISDTARYMMLGNSVAVPCVAYILSAIAEAHEMEGCSQ